MKSTRRPDGDGSSGGALCLSCGLCCQGVLHDHATLEPEESELAGRLSLPVYTNESGREVFSLPCPCHRNDRCSVYPNRPSACGAYQCHVLERQRDGTLSLDESLTLVSQARGLIDALTRHMGDAPDGSGSIWQRTESFRARQEDALGRAEFVRLHAGFLTDMTRLVALVRREFLPKTGRKGSAAG